jgi:hypothetical protein
MHPPSPPRPLRVAGGGGGGAIQPTLGTSALDWEVTWHYTEEKQELTDSKLCIETYTARMVRISALTASRYGVCDCIEVCKNTELPNYTEHTSGNVHNPTKLRSAGLLHSQHAIIRAVKSGLGVMFS